MSDLYHAINRMKLPRFVLIAGLLLSVGAAAVVNAEPAGIRKPLKYDPSVCDGAGEAAMADHSAELSPACAEMVAAFPQPVGVTYVQEDRRTLSSYSFWKVGPDATPTYDGPGGNIIGEIPAGFNYVNAVDQSVDGWIQIRGGQWLPTDSAVNNPPSYHRGVQLLNGLVHPVAIVLDLSRVYVSEYPGGPSSPDTGRFLKRYELVNIYDEVYDEDGWHWYMIGPNQWVKQTFVSVFKKTERPENATRRWVAIDLYEQSLIAYEGETPVFATLVSTGIPPKDTNEGVFEIWAQLEADPMSGSTGAPDAYALEFVPWVIYFDGGISLHGTYWHDLFGYRQSRGCVNLSISDARFIYNFLLYSENEDEEVTGLGKTVYVYSSGEYGSGVLRS